MTSTQTLAVCDASELKDGQLYVRDDSEDCDILLTPTIFIFRKQVDFGEGKVLLSKIGNDIHATSAFCTHYGAPLASKFLIGWQAGNLVRLCNLVCVHAIS